MLTNMTNMTNRIEVGGGKSMDTWTVADAKAKFSEVMDRARSDGPQMITRKGRPAVVIVAAEEWDRKTKRTGNLAEWFAASPLRESDLSVERLQDPPRDIEL
ncbi:MAG TPA: type II toxin-antitoxin system Phd/YefM family antitoxin [Chloroflexota bacterium]|nr:type II toxin-antitoxin system Phd/YefM family antitoxin [Chloroflexota bacterium]